jgi:hypothetical protein
MNEQKTTFGRQFRLAMLKKHMSENYIWKLEYFLLAPRCACVCCVGEYKHDFMRYNSSMQNRFDCPLINCSNKHLIKQ